MQIFFGNNVKVEESFQDPFPERLECKCGGQLRPAMQVLDDEAQCSKMIPEDIEHNQNKKGYKKGEANMWPHDSMAVIFYICPYCFNKHVEMNQA